MFNANKSTDKYIEDARRSSGSGAAMTIIAHGVKVEGDFTSQSDVLIEGEVQGNLTTSGLLTVGSEAKIKADVKAGEALISGTIVGNVVVAKRCEIKSTAKVTGDVTSETLAIEGGAELNGRVQVGIKTAAMDLGSAPASRRMRPMEQASV